MGSLPEIRYEHLPPAPAPASAPAPDVWRQVVAAPQVGGPVMDAAADVLAVPMPRGGLPSSTLANAIIVGYTSMMASGAGGGEAARGGSGAAAGGSGGSSVEALGDAAWERVKLSHGILRPCKVVLPHDDGRVEQQKTEAWVMACLVDRMNERSG